MRRRRTPWPHLAKSSGSPAPGSFLSTPGPGATLCSPNCCDARSRRGPSDLVRGHLPLPALLSLQPVPACHRALLGNWRALPIETALGIAVRLAKRMLNTLLGFELLESRPRSHSKYYNYDPLCTRRSNGDGAPLFWLRHPAELPAGPVSIQSLPGSLPLPQGLLPGSPGTRPPRQVATGVKRQATDPAGRLAQTPTSGLMGRKCRPGPTGRRGPRGPCLWPHTRGCRVWKGPEKGRLGPRGGHREPGRLSWDRATLSARPRPGQSITCLAVREAVCWAVASAAVEGWGLLLGCLERQRAAQHSAEAGWMLLSFLLCCLFVWVNSFIARGQHDIERRILDLELVQIVFESYAFVHM